MSDRTSHRRKARRHSAKTQRALGLDAPPRVTLHREDRPVVLCPQCNHDRNSFSCFTTCTLNGEMK